jgi:hypothetical protein
MSAAEFVAFWGGERMASVATVSASGHVHAAPLDVRLVDGKFYVATFPDSQRLRDHRAKARCAITSWDGPYRAVIVYGDARETAATGRATAVAAEQGYDVRTMITIEVTPTRIYGIRPPPGHQMHDDVTPAR